MLRCSVGRLKRDPGSSRLCAHFSRPPRVRNGPLRYSFRRVSKLHVGAARQLLSETASYITPPATYHHKLQIFKDVDVLSHTVPRPSVVENHLSHYDSMTPHIDSMAVIPVRIREVEHSTRIFRGFSHHFRCHHSLLVDRRHHAGTVGRWHPSTKGIEC